jgi:uncharacterized cupin superfamily protein
MATWDNVVNLDALKLEKGESAAPYEYEYNRPAGPMGAKKLGFNVATVPPGQYSCPYHFHHSEEELFLVLEGRARLRQNGQVREVGRGDLIFFPTGPQGAHQFHNHTGETFRILAISTRDELEVAEYPDSGKIMVGKLRKVFQRGTEVAYEKDEMDPGRFWPPSTTG